MVELVDALGVLQNPSLNVDFTSVLSKIYLGSMWIVLFIIIVAITWFIVTTLQYNKLFLIPEGKFGKNIVFRFDKARKIKVDGVTKYYLKGLRKKINPPRDVDSKMWLKSGTGYKDFYIAREHAEGLLYYTKYHEDTNLDAKKIEGKFDIEFPTQENLESCYRELEANNKKWVLTDMLSKWAPVIIPLAALALFFVISIIWLKKYEVVTSMLVDAASKCSKTL